MSDCYGVDVPYNGYYVVPAPGEIERLDLNGLQLALFLMARWYSNSPEQLAARGTVDDARNAKPGHSDRCRQCGRTVTWASMRAQLGRLLRAGMPRERAVASVPCCRACNDPAVVAARAAKAKMKARHAAAARSRAERRDRQRRELQAWASRRSHARNQ